MRRSSRTRRGGAPTRTSHTRQACNLDPVRAWRGRFAHGGPWALADHKRSGRPTRFNALQVAEAKALACRLPAETGVPLSRWSYPELAAELTSPTSPRSGISSEHSKTRTTPRHSRSRGSHHLRPGRSAGPARPRHTRRWPRGILRRAGSLINPRRISGPDPSGSRRRTPVQRRSEHVHGQ
ncbi:helix-turn-helix domain-containing protein [Streptomyces aquilus]|uniref:helix-turn-helix domain-containing protein n=1 Tax=Streptomyces aquilus TaxID=2548456 RepID=UPI0037D957AE